MRERSVGNSPDAESGMVGTPDGGGDHAGRMERIAFDLHEMCQPLMALQYRLEIGKMVDTAEAYEEAVLGGLQEYDRLLVSVEVLRDEVRRGLDALRP